MCYIVDLRTVREVKILRYNSSGFFEERLSLLGFGGKCLPRNPDGTVDRKASAELFDMAFSGGITYFYCTSVLSDTESEEVFGENLSKRNRDSYFIGSGISPLDFRSGAEAEQFINEQLRRFHTGYFDYYVVENFDADSYKRAKEIGLRNILRKEKELGRIRRIGFSFTGNHRDWRKFTSGIDWDFAELSANYLDWESKNIVFIYHELIKRRLPFFANDPFCRGKLLELAEEHKRILAEADPLLTLKQWALQWFFDKKQMLSLVIDSENAAALSDEIEIMSNPRTINSKKRHALKTVIDLISREQNNT